MIYYILTVACTIIFDRVKNKIVQILFYSGSKQLLICYYPSWHNEQRKILMGMLEWVLL